MKPGSIGEMPPNTRRSCEFSARIASAAMFTIAAKVFHSRSTSKSQCDRLFGSFQSITASTTLPPHQERLFRLKTPGAIPAAADEHLFLGTIEDLKAGASQHGQGAGCIRNPPVRRVLGIAVFDEVQAWKSGALEDLGFRKRIVSLNLFHARAAAQQ